MLTALAIVLLITLLGLVLWRVSMNIASCAAAVIARYRPQIDALLESRRPRRTPMQRLAGRRGGTPILADLILRHSG